MLTPNAPVAAIARAPGLSDRRDTSTVGGCADTEANAVTVIPHGRPSSRQVTRVTPLASVLIASANEAVGSAAFVAAADFRVMARSSSVRKSGGGWPHACTATGPVALYAATMSTVTGTPFVTMSKTAEHCCARP